MLLPYGPLHILVLHLPIGALLATLFLELLPGDANGYKRRYIGRLHLFLLITTIATLILGLAYEDFGGYGDEIESHERWGYIFSASVLATYLLHCIYRWKTNLKTRLSYYAALIFATFALILTGHTGGESVHGKGFITKPFRNIERPANTPPPKLPEKNIQKMDTKSTESPTAIKPPPANSHTDKTKSSSQEDANSGNDLAPDTVKLFNQVHATLERSCYSCHGATKQKGRYRLDSKTAAFSPGKSGLTPITAGKPSASELLTRISLPAEHDDVMPPIEKPRLSAEQIDAVRKWIDLGAPWPTDDELKIAAESAPEIGDSATNERIERLNQTGAKAEYNAWGDQSIRLDLGVVDDDKLSEALAQLSQLSSKLTWLDCSKLQLPTTAYTTIRQLNQLQRLHLDSSNIRDADLQAIATLPKLSYLNLYNTAITDNGLQHLHQAPALKKLYLSSTQVSSTGIQKLQQAKPQLKIIHN